MGKKFILRQNSSLPMDMLNFKTSSLLWNTKMGPGIAEYTQTLLLKKRKWKAKKELLAPDSSEIHPGKQEEGSGPKPISLGSTLWACSSALWAILPFYKGQPVFKAEESYQPISCLQNFGALTVLLHFVSGPFSPSWQCFCWCKVLKCLVGLPYLYRLTLLVKRFLHRSCLDNPISIFSFCLNAEGICESHLWSLRVVCVSEYTDLLIFLKFEQKAIQ